MPVAAEFPLAPEQVDRLWDEQAEDSLASELESILDDLME